MTNTNQKALMALVQDMLCQGVVQTMLADNTMLNVLPVIRTNGAQLYQWNEVAELTETTAREIGESVGASVIEPVRQNVVLSLYSNDALTDRAYLHQYGNLNDVRAENASIHAKALGHDLTKDILYGDKDTTPKQMDGFASLVKKERGQAITGAITLDTLAEAVDIVRYSVGQYMIVVSPKTRRDIAKLIRQENGFVETMNVAGQNVTAFDGVAIVPCHAVKDGEAFVINANAEDGVALVTSNGIIAQDLGCQDGVNYRTMIEGSFAVITKNPRALVHIKQGTRTK